MKTIQVYLNDGNTVTINVSSYNAEDFAEKMNDQKIFMISIGDLIVNKTFIRYILPVPVTPAQ